MSLLTPDFGLVVWMMISFGIVVFVLVKFGFPVILDMVEKRNNYIDESLLMAQQARDQLAKVKADSEALVAEARKEQVNILAEAAKTRDQIINAAKDKAGIEAAAVMENARRQLHLEKEEAIRDVRRMVSELSVEIAEKVLREKLSAKQAQMDIIDRLLDEVNIPKS